MPMDRILESHLIIMAKANFKFHLYPNSVPVIKNRRWPLLASRRHHEDVLATVPTRLALKRAFVIDL